MKIRLLDNTNIRIDINNLSISPIGIVFGGAIIEVENSIYNGQAIDGVHAYFKDIHGWYYWSGKAIILYQSLPSPHNDTSRMNSGIGIPEKIEIKSQEIIEPVEQDVKLESEEPTKTLETAFIQEEETAITEEIDGIQEIKPTVDEISVAAPLAQEPLPPDDALGGLAMPPAITSPPKGTPFRKKQINKAAIEHQIPDLYWKNKNLTGKNIRIAILDTGISLEEFSNHSKIIEQKDFIHSESGIHDNDGHGTFSTTLIGNSMDSNMPGLAPHAELIIGKIKEKTTDQVSITLLKDSISWAINAGAELVLINHWENTSFLGPLQFDDLKKFFASTTSQSVCLVAPVGESSLVKPISHFPASFEECLSVGVHNKNKLVGRRSIRSKHLDILAPSGSDYFDYPDADSGIAAAYTTGVIALNLELLKRKGFSFSNQQMMQLIRVSASSLQKKRTLDRGYGNLNPKALLDLVEQQQHLGY